MGILTAARSTSCRREIWAFLSALLYIHPAKANRWVGNENQEGEIYMFLIILSLKLCSVIIADCLIVLLITFPEFFLQL